jgi:hypothetical protein
MTKQFTSKKPKLSFNIDDDEFEAYAVLPARQFAIFADKVGTLQKAGADYNGTDKVALSFDETVSIVLDSVEMALTAESAERLATRISDPDNPVDMNTLTELLTWILEQWGLVAAGEARPTKPPSDSSNGAAETGVGSEEN